MFVLPHGLDGAALDGDDPIRHGRQSGVVGDDDDRNALLAAGILQQLQNLLTGFVVERARGLVAQEQLGISFTEETTKELSAENKILLAEYFLDFAMQASNYALLMSLEAIHAQNDQPTQNP